MSSDRPPFNIEVSIDPANSNLLVGLDEWLRLGLIDDRQVKRLSQRYLACKLPIIKETVKLKVPKVAETSLVKVAAQPNILVRVWQAFLDELSIRWLLFLGIFLVVVSSGVLAAIQWRNFPIFGQYLILCAYTLSFWGIGSWLGKQDNLKLTSQSLRNIAILLVPINFWAMSSFSLINSPIGWGTIAIAGLCLTVISYWYYKQQSNRFLALFLGLSYLHLGWGFANFSLWGVYLGIIAIATSSYYFLIIKQTNIRIVNLLVLLSAWSLLFIRTVTISGKTSRLGLAIAIAGWLIAVIYLYLQRQVAVTTTGDTKQQNISIINRTIQPVTNIILWIGWLISLGNSLFWQTAGVNILGWHLAWQRLNIYWRKRDILAIFFIGLQGIYLTKELFPDSLRKNALSLSAEVTRTEYFPESVFGVTLFPYLLAFVAIASWLYRREKKELAVFSEGLSLLFGLSLTGLSFSNPTWRVLNLLLSCFTVGYISYVRQPTRKVLIYVSHGLGLLTIGSAIALLFPNLNATSWGIISLLFMAAEWGIFLTFKVKNSYRKIWYFSCWYFGLLLAGISYICLLAKTTPYISLVWLLIPLMLTAIAKHTRSIKQRRLAVLFSCIALFSVQLLTFTNPLTRFLSLTFAVGLMFKNVYYLRRTITAEIHIGFILASIASLLWGSVIGWNWLIVGAIAIVGLYQARSYLIKIAQSPRLSYISERIAKGRLGVGAEANNFKLVQKYAKAVDYWILLIAIVNLTFLSLSYASFAAEDGFLKLTGIQFIATSILMGGTISRRYKTQPLALYTIAWLTELGIFGAIILLDRNSFTIAVANVILGLLSLFLVNKYRTNSSEIAQIPFVYALLAMFWRLSYFNAYTGGITLGAAIIGMGVSQKNNNKQLNYLSLAGISCGIYELIIYQMSRSPGGNIADGFTVLSLVAAAIAFTYRLAAWLWRKRNLTSIFSLDLDRLILIAHIHWAIASVLKVVAAGIAIESTNPRFTPLSIAVSFFLGAYAIVQGRDKSSKTADWWVYVGLVEIAATLTYSRLIINRLSFFDPWRIIFTIAIALLIYQIPWQNFGWRSTPWQRTAIAIPALMALVTAESISYLSLLITAVFYLRIALSQRNIRWSYISLGFINWGVIRLIWQYNTEFIWYAAVTTISLLYIAQFDPYLQQNAKQRHNLRLIASSIICIVALFYQDTGIIPSVVSMLLVVTGLGLRVRAFLFTGTIAFIVTILYQLVIVVATYTFLKWIIGLIAGIAFIAVAANFESKRDRDRVTTKLKSYLKKLQNWQ